MHDSFLRQRNIINQKRLSETSMTVVGCGSIGSFSALTLSKMGLGRLVLYDNDVVNVHNISNQFFEMYCLGENKAQETERLCRKFSCFIDPNEQNILVMPFKFKEQPINTDIVLASTDTIESRLNVFEQALKSKECKLYIDVRMLADNLKVFTVNLKDKKITEQFKEDFLTDVHNQLAPCTARTIIYNVLLCSSLICNIVKKHVNKEHIPFHIAYGFKNNIQILDRESFKN